MSKASKHKCPTCGSTLKSTNFEKQILKLRLSHSVEYGKLFDHIVKLINNSRSIPLTDRDIYGFLNAVSDCDDEVSIVSMNSYIDNNYAISGKGLPYLSAMIINSSATKKSRQEYEFKTLDRLPPKIDEG